VKRFIHLGWDVHFASISKKYEILEGIKHIKLPSTTKKRGNHVFLNTDYQLELFRTLYIQKLAGLRPDLIYWHTGWGLGTYLNELFPSAKKIAYCEWWFNLNSSDYLFDKGNTMVSHTVEARLTSLLRNLSIGHEISISNALVTPTSWQKQQLPKALAKKCQVIFDGIDLGFFGSSDRCNKVVNLEEGEKLITYATRGLEVYRGFPEFMAAAIKVLQRHKNWHVAVAGNDKQNYFKSQTESGKSLLVQALEEAEKMGVSAQIHYLGVLSLQRYRDLLVQSNLHCYFTRPFVLSWSCLEAAATGVPLLLSNTEPVMEFCDGLHSTLLVNHKSKTLDTELEEYANSIFTLNELHDSIREKRAELLKKISHNTCISMHEELAKKLLTSEV